MTKKRIQSTLISLLVLLILITGGIILHKRRAEEITNVPVETIAPWALHVAKVSDEQVDSGFPALAKLSASEEVVIMSRISGRILTMGPREGIRVHKGDLLVRIDTREIEDGIHSLKAQHIAAKAETNRARNELARERKLLTDSGSSKSAVETRRTVFVAAAQKVKSLEHEINALEVQKGYGTITSPTEGVIAARSAEPGDMAVPGRPLYRITSVGGALVQVRLPQSVLHNVHLGTPMVLSYDDREITLPVNRIFPTVDARALGFVEADVDTIPFDLPSGSRVACRIILEQATDGVMVPNNSVFCGADREQCRVARILSRDGKNVVDMVPVKIILQGHDGVAVQGSLNAGDLVVIAHEIVLLQLKNGDPVTLARGELP